MLTFPEFKFTDAGSFATAYFCKFNEAATTINKEKLEQAATILTKIYTTGGMVYSCGNGGSTAIANHLVCDHTKLVQTDTKLLPRIVSLSTTVEMIIAIGNDICFDDIFVYQLRSLGKPGDALITISSSGDSENVVRAASWARENGLSVISLSGWSGGRSANIADVNIHVNADNYGIIEDVHQALMHILAQYIRQAHMEEELIKQRKF